MSCKLNQCCCGCSLRTGAIAISVFSLISSVVSIIRIVLNFSALKGISSNDAKMLYGVIVGELVGAMVLMFTIFLVLLAAVKNRMPNLMLPWLVVQIVSIIAMFLYLIILAIAGANIGVVEILIACVGGALGFYFWLVVFSYYQELKANATTEQLPDEKATGQL
ncbi:uncharacterized protein LOC124205325 [Daphnia pulex]|uniref:uncharacterized protein LOC124205325 n=1 Tax=Daphnia pulex TaxID=6669 RepID=UPI001EDDFECD|nr:uncharacterized protein LOC124205325 [Daphnia pulex]XP_046458673.1 uncharacterized protein LOC124205325 [Daphnia pulex]